MKTSWKPCLRLVLMMAAASTEFARGAVVGDLAANLTITISVRNYADVDAKTLNNAEYVAAEVFRKMNIGIQWTDAPIKVEQEQHEKASPARVDLTEIQINILSSEMAKNLVQTGHTTGLTPGSGSDRHMAYIFFHRVQELAQQQVKRWVQRFSPPAADNAHVLAYTIAHELGHVLGLSGHSPTGIMRAEWNFEDLQDARLGYLAFTPQQASIIKAEVGRRMIQRNAAESANERTSTSCR